MTFTSTKVHQTKRMWNGGPLRQFSTERGTASWTALDGGGYGGQYVCDECGFPVVGLYKAAAAVWRCSECREAHRPKQEPRTPKTIAPSGTAL